MSASPRLVRNLLKTVSLFSYVLPDSRTVRAFSFEKITPQRDKMSTDSTGLRRYLCGTMVISRNAAMRSGSGGWVLKREENVPPPNIGLTMQSDEVDGEIALLGIRLL